MCPTLVKNELSDDRRRYTEKLYRYFRRVFPPGHDAGWDYQTDLARHMFELANREYVDLAEIDELLTLTILFETDGSGHYEVQLFLTLWRDSLLVD